MSAAAVAGYGAWIWSWGGARRGRRGGDGVGQGGVSSVPPQDRPPGERHAARVGPQDMQAWLRGHTEPAVGASGFLLCLSPEQVR